MNLCSVIGIVRAGRFALLRKENKMIFGKSYKQQNEKRKRGHWFAWYPVKFEDGRWCWWQQVWRIPKGGNDLVWYNYFDTSGVLK